jgi:GT2 family glycosyltransferase
MENHRPRPLATSPFSSSAVDIIIPFHAQYEKVSSLVRSILISVKSNPYQITLVDDCSDNAEFGKEVNREFGKSLQVRCIRSDSPLGFGGSLKFGFDSTKNPWVLFMHSDCLVEDPNFMLNMGRSLLNWKREGLPVKMVTARADNPGDCVEAKWDGEPDRKDSVLKDKTMPTFCFMCNRDLFQFIGGFVKQYPFAWYEDEELSYRMRKFGLYQGVCGRSWVRHQGGATIKYLWTTKPESKEVMESNRERCLRDMRSLSKNNS